MTTATPTPTPITHFASLAAVLESGDREALVRTFDEMAAEALVLAEKAPTEKLWRLALDLHETFHHEASAARAVAA